jgi:hypothetical protein
MTHYQPPHEVTCEDKLASLIEAFRTNQDITPIAVQGDFAFTGSHRIEAHRQAYELWNTEAAGWDREKTQEPVLEAIEVDDETYLAACAREGVEHHEQIGDYDAICSALYDATDDAELKAALEDQR